MNFRAPSKPAAIDIDLTPLINIVFLMLIFFMLAGTLKPDDAIQTAEVDGASMIEDDLLVIVMTIDGELSVKGENIDRQALNLLLEAKTTLAGKVAIKPDSRLAAEQLLSLTEELRESGFSEVTLIVVSP
ncbi:MAG: biopolymer transport protein ExbD [Granulosicoccus sp.]|jgi:biopolymer transport protein ExbD